MVNAFMFCFWISSSAMNIFRVHLTAQAVWKRACDLPVYLWFTCLSDKSSDAARQIVFQIDAFVGATVDNRCFRSLSSRFEGRQALAYGGGPWHSAPPSDPKNKKMYINSTRQWRN